MAGDTVKKLAETVGTTVENLLEQLVQSGVSGKSADDIISKEEKMRLIRHLRKPKGGGGGAGGAGDAGAAAGDSGSEGRVTLRRKKLSQLEVPTAQGRLSNTVNVEFRKRQSYVERGAAEGAAEKSRGKKTAPKKTATAKAGAAKGAAKQAATSKAAAAKTPKPKTAKPARPPKAAKGGAAKSSPAASAAPAAGAKAAPAAGQETGRRRELHIASDKRGKRKVKKKHKRLVKVVSPSKHVFEKPTAPVKREVVVPESITVAGLAQRMAVKSGELIKQMMDMGMMATINQTLDQDTAILVVEELGHRARPGKKEDAEAGLVSEMQAVAGDRVERPPVVIVMGHVDHGKTSLLDTIRRSKVTDSEAGGITQHIGAYRVETARGTVVFLDTPGHAAFTAMRARGARVTDIAVLVVAADDGVMPQTVEAMEHAKAAGVPVIVAISKIDRDDADVEKVKGGLAEHGLLSEAWGGDNIFVEVSAKTGQGVDDLLEAILLQAEIMELKAPEQGPARGVIIESSVDKGRGAIATMLVQQGTLRKGDTLLAGNEFGRIRALLDENGAAAEQATPSMPVLVLGLSGAPAAGDEALVVGDEKKAREVANLRRERMRESAHAARQQMPLGDTFDAVNAGASTLNLLIKADVQGIAEALRDSLMKIESDEVQLKILSSGIGGINVSDVNLAAASSALVIGFNVRADGPARKAAAEQDVTIRYYSIVYELVDDIRQIMSDMLAPEIKEEIVGIAEVKDVFRSSRLGAVAGCQVIEGMVKRGNPIRVLRDNVVIFEGGLESLRRFKDDVAEVSSGTECGMAVKDYNDVKVGDHIEVYEKVETRRTL